MSMRTRLALPAAAVALVALLPLTGHAWASVYREVQTDLRSGVYEIEITATILYAGGGISGTSVGVGGGQGYANVRWMRKDFKGDPFFECVSGPITFDADDVAGVVRLRGSLPEFFHNGFVKIDLTVQQGSPAPFYGGGIAVSPLPAPGAGVYLGAGIRWAGTVSGAVSSSLGALSGIAGTATSSLVAGS